MEYKVMLEAFEGPMDLLLHLIDKAQIDIYDIPIYEITEQYLDYLNKMGDMDLEVTSEFLLMASTLLEIKSKMLLPKTKENNDVQLYIEETDPRLELVQNLLEYKKIKIASKKLHEYEEVQRKVFYKPKEDLSSFSNEEFELEDMDINKLVRGFKNLILTRTKENVLTENEIQNEEFTLSKCIQNIKDKLKRKKKIYFSQLFKKNTDKSEVVATFLSLLELIKNKYATVKQKDNFEEILISQKVEEGEEIGG